MTALKHQNFQYPERQTLSSLSCGLDFLRPKICFALPLGGAPRLRWHQNTRDIWQENVQKGSGRQWTSGLWFGAGPLWPYQWEHAVAPGIMTPQKWFVTDWSCLIDIKHVHESDVVIGRPNVSRKSSLPLRIFEGLCLYIIAFFSSSWDVMSISDQVVQSVSPASFAKSMANSIHQKLNMWVGRYGQVCWFTGRRAAQKVWNLTRSNFSPTSRPFSKGFFDYDNPCWKWFQTPIGCRVCTQCSRGSVFSCCQRHWSPGLMSANRTLGVHNQQNKARALYI